MFLIQVGRLAGVVLQIVKLSRRRPTLRFNRIWSHTPFAGAGVVVTTGTFVVKVFPIAFANSERKADRLVKSVPANRFLLARESGEHADTVFSGFVGQFVVYDFRARGHDVG